MFTPCSKLITTVFHGIREMFTNHAFDHALKVLRCTYKDCQTIELTAFYYEAYFSSFE